MEEIPYKEMYETLLYGIESALFGLEKRNIDFAKELLIQAQLKAESLYIDAEE